MVAFHFYRTSQAGWKCDQCRRQGLDVKRRCGFLAEEKRGPKKLVWVRGRVSSEECPKSLITGESLALLEEFFVRRRLGIPDSLEMEARKVDAFLILRDEMEREERDGAAQH